MDTNDTINEVLHWEQALSDLGKILEHIKSINQGLMDITAEALSLIPGANADQMLRLSQQLSLVRSSQEDLLAISELFGAVGALVQGRLNVIKATTQG